MAEKPYAWSKGAVLEEHSRRKHKILREYFFEYLTVRCKLPQQEKFRLAIVDGFAGGGRYRCGTSGSPLIFVEELKRAVEMVNVQRASQGMGLIEIECLLVLNDHSRDAIEELKTNVAPLQAEIAETVPRLHLRVEYLNEAFERAYPTMKRFLEQGRYRNVLFNLDQCGYSHVDRNTLLDIMRSHPSVEIFYTFMISSLLSFLQKSDPVLLAAQLRPFGIDSTNLASLEGGMSKPNWLGAAERLVFETFRTCAPFVSPFSVNNPGGWRYWLIHFANIYRGRQVYNNILHQNSSSQAHYGRSGLNMLAYDPSHDDGSLYLFDLTGREGARNQLLEDIPRLISESGDVIGVGDFYESIYNATPAHTDDVHSAIIENPDVEVITPAGGERRKANTIAVGDMLKLKTQKSFFPMFLNASTKRGR
ncbi:three-Cys-motif partner protein TcmP [Sphingomonas glacialis]|uniref:Three-Cys-motif partner protein TcmP n=1 Tax=Sphingomonas glacialis TaxID=658225 RepID=A0A502FT34_9SPHN|nr:three-Cys-motif partner protein TcmP [Sphingomonas glacialis]TPG52570.1 three-Cys-motif partner protein TcmP [Sphingomonas glacialis]